MSSEPKTTSSTLGPERGFCEGFKAGVEGVEVMEATSGAIGFGDDDARRGAQSLWGCERRAWTELLAWGLARREGTCVDRGLGRVGLDTWVASKTKSYIPPQRDDRSRSTATFSGTHVQSWD